MCVRRYICGRMDNVWKGITDSFCFFIERLTKLVLTDGYKKELVFRKELIHVFRLTNNRNSINYHRISIIKKGTVIVAGCVFQNNSSKPSRSYQ